MLALCYSNAFYDLSHFDPHGSPNKWVIDLGNDSANGRFRIQTQSQCLIFLIINYTVAKGFFFLRRKTLVTIYWHSLKTSCRQGETKLGLGGRGDVPCTCITMNEWMNGRGFQPAETIERWDVASNLKREVYHESWFEKVMGKQICTSYTNTLHLGSTFFILTGLILWDR